MCVCVDVKRCAIQKGGPGVWTTGVAGRVESKIQGSGGLEASRALPRRGSTRRTKNRKREKGSGRSKGRDVMMIGGREYWRGIFPVGCFGCLAGLLRCGFGWYGYRYSAYVQGDYGASTRVRGSASFLRRAFDNGVVFNVVRNM